MNPVHNVRIPSCSLLRRLCLATRPGLFARQQSTYPLYSTRSDRCDVRDESNRHQDIFRLNNVKHSIARCLRRFGPAEAQSISDTPELSWLKSKGYDALDFERWQRIIQCNSADEAYNLLDRPQPTHIFLRIISMPVRSRQTFQKLLELFRSSADRLDDSSKFHSYRKLLRSGLQLDPALLRLLQEDTHGLPQSISSFQFNRLLRITSSRLLRHPAVAIMQTCITDEMSRRGHHISKEGYEALLSGQGHDAERRHSIMQQMNAAGHHLTKDYLLDPALTSGRYRLRAKHNNAKVLSVLPEVTSVQEALDHLEQHDGDLSDYRLWALLLTNRKISREVTSLCISMIETGALPLTCFLAGLLFKSSGKSRKEVETLCLLAVKQGIEFDTFAWTQCAERMISHGRLTEVISLMTLGTLVKGLPEMTVKVRHDPRLWSSVIKQINNLRRRKEMTVNRYIRTMGKIWRAVSQEQFHSSRVLLWSLLDAAVLSGPRSWAGVHSCDAVAGLYRGSIDQGSEPWKLQSNMLLWTSYMRVLVANEETTLLVEAMTTLLKLGQRPDSKLLKLFALGVWESGNIDYVEAWRQYFEDKMHIRWPSTEETFSFRNVLEEGDMKFFWE